MWLAIYLYTIAIPLLIAGAKPLHDIHAISGGDDDFIVPHYPYFPLRILPLGASITWGQASTDGNGYRNHLRELLEQRCTLVDMVGNVQSGGMPDNDNEGHPGARVDQVAQFAENDISFQPNLILINAGTNDVVREDPIGNPISKIGERMDKLIKHLFDTVPNVTIILSTLILNIHEGADERIQKIVNPQYKALVKRLQERQARIVLADLHSVIKAEELVDGTHPNDKGYEKIAEAWVKAIAEAGRKGLLVEPQDQGPEINRPPKAALRTHDTMALSVSSKISWATHNATVSTVLAVHGIVPMTPSTTATPPKAIHTPEMSCSITVGQGLENVGPRSDCSVLGQPPAYVSKNLPSVVPMSNSGRSNKRFWSGRYS